MFTAAVCHLSDAKSWTVGAGVVALDSTKALAAGTPGSIYAAVARGAELFSLDAKSLQPLRSATLPDPALFLHVRGDDVIVVTSRQLLVYSLATLTVRTTINTLCKDPTDLAVHPSQRVCWIAGTDPSSPSGFKSHRILQVNETSGNAVWLAGAYGKLVGISPDGKSLYAGIKEDFSNSAVAVDMWGQSYQLTQFGFIDLVMHYKLYGPLAMPEQLLESPGESLRKIVVSPDGRQVSAVAAGGFRATAGNMNGYMIPAFKAEDLKVCETTFQTDAEPTFIAYHPTLDIVVAGNQKQFRAFDRKTGTARGINLGTADGLTAVSAAFFTGDMGKVCILGTHPEHGNVLIAVDLALSDAEKWKANEFQGKAVADAPASMDKRSKPVYVRPKLTADVALSQLSALSQTSKLNPMTPKEVAEKYNGAVVVVSHATGSGSGFLISSDGFIATCAHVLPNNNKIKVQIQNLGALVTMDAVVIERDDEQDLALLKATPKFTCQYVCFERNKLPQMGEEVTIIGNPGLGDTILSNTMTQGIVSNPLRRIDEVPFIQTTAAVNPGTSGSPLFNSYGNVIGLITLKGRIEAAGFAVPMERIKAFLQRCCEPPRQ